jgi:hypothetical protein
VDPGVLQIVGGVDDAGQRHARQAAQPLEKPGGAEPAAEDGDPHPLVIRRHYE